MVFFFIAVLLFQESSVQVRAVDGGMAGHAVGVLGGKIAVPRGSGAVATETQVGGALVGQHVPVMGAMDFVAGGAALDLGGLVFIEKRSPFVGMAADAQLIFESGQPHPSRRFVLIMTSRAFQDAFLKTMAFVHHKLRPDIFVAGQADLTRPHLFARAFHHFGVTGGAIHGGFSMGTRIKTAAGQGVTFETFFSFGIRFVCLFKREDAPGASSLFQVGRRISMAVGTQGLDLEGRLRPLIRLDGRVADELEIGADILMAFSADTEILLLFLAGGSGRREQADGRDGKRNGPQPAERE
jgi:hypothetical protein